MVVMLHHVSAFLDACKTQHDGASSMFVLESVSATLVILSKCSDLRFSLWQSRIPGCVATSKPINTKPKFQIDP